LIERIRTHNRLNGVWFSVIEFALIALVVSPFGVYYARAGSVVYAITAVGIVLNCLIVVLLGVRQLRAREPSATLRQRRDSNERARIRRAHPHLFADTL
jgi:hypothetical protein